MKPIPGLGQRIQRERERCGLTVQELAQGAGTTYQTIWRIEKGEQKDPSIALVRGIAKTLGIGVDRLIGMFGPDEDKDSERLAAAVA